MQKFFLLSGTILSALSVAIGAFGAHALKDILLKNNRMEVFETAFKYQFFHALGLLIIGILLLHTQNAWIRYAGISMMVGIVIFSGSLYILSLSNVGFWGAITPLGGLAFILAWVFLAIGIYKGF